jgi:hypothetical protein
LDVADVQCVTLRAGRVGGGRASAGVRRSPGTRRGKRG